MAVLQREIKMSIYISALPGEVCRNNARLLAMQCTSAAPEIIRINSGWEHGAEALPLKTLERDPADWLQTPLVQSKVRSIKLYFKNHTRHLHFIIHQNKNWINSPRRDEHLTSCLVPMCQWNKISHVTRHILLYSNLGSDHGSLGLNSIIKEDQSRCCLIRGHSNSKTGIVTWTEQSYSLPFLSLFSTSKGFN